MNRLLVRKSPYVSTAIYGLLCGLFCVLSVWASYKGISDWSSRTQKEFWNQMGVLSLVLSIASFSLWLFKKKIIKAKRADRNAYSWANSTVIHSLRETHVTLGWVAFSLGLGHSIFFLINLQPRDHVLSGVIALIVMIALVFSGLMYKHKLISLKIIQNSHLLIACIFGVCLLSHL